MAMLQHNTLLPAGKIISYPFGRSQPRISVIRSSVGKISSGITYLQRFLVPQSLRRSEPRPFSIQKSSSSFSLRVALVLCFVPSAESYPVYLKMSMLPSFIHTDLGISRCNFHQGRILPHRASEVSCCRHRRFREFTTLPFGKTNPEQIHRKGCDPQGSVTTQKIHIALALS